MPVYNASCWLDECLQAVLHQDFTGAMELSVFDDASTVSLYVCIFTRLNMQFGPEYETAVEVQLLYVCVCVYVCLCVLQDDSRKVVEGWRERLEARGISVVISGHNSAQPRGGQ